MTFKMGYRSHGFRDGNELAELAYNGTFFDSDYFPSIGYNRGVELDDPRRRREEKLGPLEEMAPRGDPTQSLYNLFMKESDWITYHTIVSTSPDQIAIAPGYLKREWQQNGRNYFEYDMGSHQHPRFLCLHLGRYNVKRENTRERKLEVYYTPGHEYDIDDMMASSKARPRLLPAELQSISVQPVPHHGVSSIPQFAQSFPNTVPYSEEHRFYQPDGQEERYRLHLFRHRSRTRPPVVGPPVDRRKCAGLKHDVGNSGGIFSAHGDAEEIWQGQDAQFLKHELDGYLRGRSGEVRHEPPLVLVQREPYVWYQKGGQIMYTLADYIGEDKVNLALHNFLMQYRYANATTRRPYLTRIPASSSPLCERKLRPNCNT